MLPEVGKLTDQNILCFRGRDESDRACPLLDATRVTTIDVAGGSAGV